MTTRTLDFQVDQVEQHITRQHDIRHAQTPTAAVKQRMAQAAESLSRAGEMRAHLDTVIETLAALCGILYHADEDGQPANFDRVTGRILVPVPWGDSGWSSWGLRKWEAGCLRLLLRERMRQRRRLPPLFDYNEFSGRWHLNFADYSTAEQAMSWVRRDGPSLAEWRTIVTEYREQAAERMRRHREP